MPVETRRNSSDRWRNNLTSARAFVPIGHRCVTHTGLLLRRQRLFGGGAVVLVQ